MFEPRLFPHSCSFPAAGMVETPTINILGTGCRPVRIHDIPYGNVGPEIVRIKHMVQCRFVTSISKIIRSIDIGGHSRDLTHSVSSMANQAVPFQLTFFR